VQGIFPKPHNKDEESVRTIGIIPARYSSTRLPGKPLKDICGKPMIQHVYERALKAQLLDDVIVATDDMRIVEAVTNFGGKAQMTSSDHVSGSDRIAEIARNMVCDLVVNIQGDEPLILPEIIDEIIEVLIKDSTLLMSTGSFQVLNPDLFDDPNVVKVVCDVNGDALYFSRSLIPYPRNRDPLKVYEHIGVYAYRKAFLMKYITFENTPLCSTESLEQLKVMEKGYKIRVVKTIYDYNALSVDTQEDLDAVIRILKKEQ
jgi:3-deoxy-manno-octulosonate cytidylyltransferase (CMP-KDO synthetase)